MSTWSDRMGFVERANVDPVCRAVLFRIAMRLDDDDDDMIEVGVVALAKFAKVSRRALTPHLCHLADAGLLLRWRLRESSRGVASRKGRDGRRVQPGQPRDSLYLLNVRRITPELWHSELVQTHPFLLRIDTPSPVAPRAETSRGEPETASPQVSDQAQKLPVVPDLGKRSGSPRAETSRGEPETASPQVSDQAQKLPVVPDLGKPSGSPRAETSRGDLLPPLSPSIHPDNGWADGREIEVNDEPEAEPDEGAQLIDDLPWKVLPRAQAAVELAKLARAALARGWTVDDLYRQLSANMWNAANSDGVMVDRLRHLPRPKPVPKPRAVPRLDRDQVEERLQRVQACDLCDQDGYRGSVLCTHDPDQVERAARGSAAVRAALAQRTNRPA